MRLSFTDVLVLAIAVIVPAAGLVLCLIQALQGDRPAAVRIGIATLLGAALYVVVFSAA